MRTITVLATAAALYTTVTLAGGPTWCTFNDDCLGYADEIITRDCCNMVHHKARYDKVFNVCLGNGGHPSNAVDHGQMAKCCNWRGAVRMCGCKATALLVKAKNRPATHAEYKAYNLTDRPEPDEDVQPNELAAEWQIPEGDPLMNTIHDKHFRHDGTVRRLPKGRANDEDYQAWCKRPGTD